MGVALVEWHVVGEERFLDHPHAILYCAGSGDGWSGYWPSTRYCCPQCGAVWATETWTPKFDYRPRPGLPPWRFTTARCEPCGGGLLLDAFHPAVLEALPETILRRELRLLLRDPTP